MVYNAIDLEKLYLYHFLQKNGDLIVFMIKLKEIEKDNCIHFAY